MMHNTTGLYNMLRENLAEIDAQIASIKADLETRINLSGAPLVWHKLQNPDGSYPAIPLLAAKAQLLSGMAALKAVDLQQRTARR